jgi:hypothetical protein
MVGRPRKYPRLTEVVFGPYRLIQVNQTEYRVEDFTGNSVFETATITGRDYARDFIKRGKVIPGRSFVTDQNE